MSNKDYNKIPAKNNMEVGRHAAADMPTQGDDRPAERPKLQSVVGTSAKKVKRSLLSRLITGIVGPDGASGIGAYVSEEIIKPAFKNIIVDAVTSGINMIMYGDRGVPNRGRTYYNGSDHRPRTNYTTSYSSRPSTGGYSRESETRSVNGVTNVISRPSGYRVEEYIIEDRFDAAHVLTSLTECAERYGVVSVADYYDLIRVESKYTDNAYGWRYDSITAARIVPQRGGHVISFPPVEAL